MNKTTRFGLTMAMMMASYGFSSGAERKQDCKNDPCFIPMQPVDECNRLPAGVFLKANYDIECPWNIFAAAEFLYWQSGIELNNMAIKIVNTPPGLTGTSTTKQVTVNLIHPNDFEPGFKVTLGADLPGYDNWQVSGSYLWYHTSTTKNFSANFANGEYIEPLAYSNGSPFFIAAGQPTAFGDSVPRSSHLKSKYTIHWNQADITLGRPFYLSKRVIANAQFGLKGLWWEQGFQLHFDGSMINMTAPGTHDTMYKAWAIGPHAGADAKFLLGCDFYLEGVGDFLLPYQRIYQTETYLNFPGLAGTNPTYQSADSYFILQPLMNAGVGLGWSSYFSCNRYHVDFAVMYEYYVTFVTADPGDPSVFFPTSLNLNGLTFKGQFDF